MTFTDRLRQMLKQPDGEKQVQQYIRDILAHPNTKDAPANVHNEYQSHTIPKTL